MTTFTWAANLQAIPQLYRRLDDGFKARLESNGCSLFRLLKMPVSDTYTLGPLVDILLSHYDSTQNVFIFGSHRLRITLEDVLFITGLPISGKPVISSSSRDTDTDAFQPLFGPKPNGKPLTIMELKSYVTNKGLGNDKRMIAALLYVISCFIAPISEGGCYAQTTYVEFVEDLAEVDSYAWGAALLAFLYTGINKWKDEKGSYGEKTQSSIDGNVWLLLCFFFIRIPKLLLAVGFEMDWIVERVRIVYKKSKDKYEENVVNILNNLSDEDIRWLPYDSCWLPPHLQDQYRFRALVAPLFCNNYVVHHRPQLVPKQFGLTEGSLAFESYDYEIMINGPYNPDYLTLYKKEIELWEEGKQLQDFIYGKRSADVAEASSPTRMKSKFDALHEQVARELTEKLGTLTRLSKEEDEQKIRLLELKIKNSEAREEKLNTEVEKLMSEVRVAREMNVKLEAKIKSSEGLEKKLMSEVRTAVERNAELGVGIKHAISSLAYLVKNSQDDDIAFHEAEGDLQEEVHSEKHKVVEKSGKKDSGGKTELKSKSVGEGSHVKDSTTGKSTQISSSSISNKEAEPGKGESVTVVAEKQQPSREEMQCVVAYILKGVDLNTVTVTLSDVLNQLGKHFGVQVMHRKAEVTELVTLVLERLYYGEEAESGDESE